MVEQLLCGAKIFLDNVKNEIFLFYVEIRTTAYQMLALYYILWSEMYLGLLASI